MKAWSFQEDYIVCKFCEKHKYPFVEEVFLDEIINKLEAEGYPSRSRSAVKKRVYDCIGLLCGRDMPSVSDLQKERCNGFSNRKYARHISEELQAYLERNCTYTDETILEIATNVAPNTIALRPIGAATPTFRELLRIYIHRSNMTEAQVYKRAQIGRDTFSNIYSGKRGASKEVVMRLCFGLKLSYDEAVDFMASANCGFNTSEIRDLVVVYFLKNKIYDTYEVNAELCERNEKMLFDGRYAYYQ